MIDPAAVRDSFRREYGREPRLFRAPGRVNLIGEHTDYNEGFVFPMAIDRETVVAAAARDDREVVVRALDFQESARFDLDRPGPTRRGHWLDYVEGVARALERRGLRLAGAELSVTSDVPAGAGLSSSAALEVSTGLALASVAGHDVDRTTLALAGQEAEHTYVGAQVGIMDQLVAARGRAGHALLIDCRTLEAVAVPVDTSRAVFVVCDTRVKHELAASAYNERRAECERAVELLRAVLPGIGALRDVSAADFERHERLLPEPVRRRARHVVNENERTLEAAAALRAGALELFGRLMYESHESLRRDFEVSSPELDALVRAAAAMPDAVFGARMTGGGFGGCTVNLVRRGAVEEFRDTVAREYNRATGRDAPVYVCEAADGAGELEANDER